MSVKAPWCVLQRLVGHTKPMVLGKLEGINPADQ